MLDSLGEIGMLGYKLVKSLVDPNVKLYLDQGELLFNPERYCHLVFKLNHLTIACLVISFAVLVVNWYMTIPCYPL